MRSALPPAALAAALAMLAGCARPRPAPPPLPAPQPHYVGETPWRSAGGIWFYPRERHEFTETGLAERIGPHPPLATDGERYDPDALLAAHQTLQLPCILRVTNLDNGRAVLVRTIDRGPATPHRMLGLSPHAMALLGGASPMRVRIELLDTPSRALAERLGADRLALSVAPLGAVAAESLPPPGVARGAAGTTARPDLPRAAETGAPPPEAALPDRYTQTPPTPAALWLRAGEFREARYARRQAATLGGMVQRENGRDPLYRVRSGPYPDAAAADAALDRALRLGLTDARIVAE